MIVVTAGTSDFRPIIETQNRRCLEFGYLHHVYDLGGLGMGTPCSVPESDLRGTIGDSLPPTTFKVRLLESAFAVALPREIVCWLDGDCIPMKPFLPAEHDWDVAVTLRPWDEVGASGLKVSDSLNAGVVWVRNNGMGRNFTHQWNAKAQEMNNDQAALVELVGPRLTREEWLKTYGNTITAETGAAVKVLDAMKWNRWHVPPAEDTRILHFKRGIRGSAKAYCK